MEEKGKDGRIYLIGNGEMDEAVDFGAFAQLGHDVRQRSGQVLFLIGSEVLLHHDIKKKEDAMKDRPLLSTLSEEISFSMLDVTEPSPSESGRHGEQKNLKNGVERVRKRERGKRTRSLT